jgi:hypothetical protein
MKKVLAVVFVCLPAFGQSAYSGLGSYSGSVVYGSLPSGGAPLTYSARTDNCVTGSESGCISGRATGEAGSTLIFQEGTSDPVPFYRLDTDTSPANCSSYTPSVASNCATAGTPFIDPDFGSYSIFVTDQTTGVSTTVFSMGSDGGYDAFGIGYANDVLMTWQTSGSVSYFAHILETNFLAHACTSSQCVVLSNVLGANCAPTPGVYSGAGICTQQQISNGTVAFSRNASDAPNTLYEANLPIVVKTTLATGGSMGVNDSVTRVAYVNFMSNSLGAIPCSVLPSDYVSYWNTGLQMSDGGALTMASAGGGSYQTAVLSGSTVLTPDTFVMPVNNITGIANFMFQASSGTTAGSLFEPNWTVSCPTQGSTCTDGSVTWTNIGKVSSQGPGFDVVHFDPHRGCSRINSRLSKLYRGTNEGVNWPGSGTADAAGQIITDDAVTCFRMGGSNCGTGGTVNLTDKFTLHNANQKYNSEYGSMSATGSGALNKNYAGGGGNWPEISATPNGSCHTTIPYTAFANWPNSLWVSGANYASGVYAASLADHNFYKLTTGAYASTPDTTDPSADPANWIFAGSYCYTYIIDWYSNLVRPILEIGPNFGADGHSAQGYSFDYRGGVYWSHYFYQPNCQNNTGGCPYVGAPNPGVRVLTVSLPSDGHPTSRNVGTGDLQPIIDPTTSVPSWGGVGMTMVHGGGTGVGGYSGAGYDEEIAFLPDGSQLLYRFGHNFNTGSNPGFGIQNAIGVISKDGKMLAYTSDFMNSRGDHGTGSATCVSPLRGQYAPAGSAPVTYLDYMLPVTNNGPQNIYQAVGFWNGSSYVFSGSGAEGSIPNWNSGCPSVGSYCTTDGTTATAPLDGTVLWKNVGPNSCRGEIGLMDVTSAHPAP